MLLFIFPRDFERNFKYSLKQKYKKIYNNKLILILLEKDNEKGDVHTIDFAVIFKIIFYSLFYIQIKLFLRKKNKEYTLKVIK